MTTQATTILTMLQERPPLLFALMVELHARGIKLASPWRRKDDQWHRLDHRDLILASIIPEGHTWYAYTVGHKVHAGCLFVREAKNFADATLRDDGWTLL
jgi:hypothetical protein